MVFNGLLRREPPFSEVTAMVRVREMEEAEGKMRLAREGKESRKKGIENIKPSSLGEFVGRPARKLDRLTEKEREKERKKGRQDNFRVI